MRRLLLLLLLAPLLLIALAACSQPGVDPAPTDPEPTEHLILVDPQTGADTNDGSPGAPVKTIRRALALAEAGTKVYLAGGTYAEASGETFIEPTDEEHGYLIPVGVEVSADPNANGTPVVIRNYGADRDAFRFAGDGKLRSVQLVGFNRGVAAAAGTQILSGVTMSEIRDAGVTLTGSADLSCTACDVSVALGSAYHLEGTTKLKVDGASSINALTPAAEPTVMAVFLAPDSNAEAKLSLGGGASTGTLAVVGGTLTLQDVEVHLRSDHRDLMIVGPEGRLDLFGGRVSGGYFVDGAEYRAALESYGTLSINGTVFENNPAGALTLDGGSADIRNAIFQDIGDPDTVFAGMGLNAITVSNAAHLKMRGTRIRNVTAAGNFTTPTPGTHGTAIYVSDASGGIDLGTAEEPGGNRFEACGFTCLNIRRGAGAHTVQAVGNLWTPNEQGADAEGRYAPGLVYSDAFGRNFYVDAPSSLQF